VVRSKRTTGAYLQFANYITATDIDSILELGSRDGKDAVLLRDHFDADVVAFEGDSAQVRYCESRLNGQARIQFVPADAGEEIPCVRIDEWCEANDFKPDLICMDLQGSELSALRSAGKILQHTRHILAETRLERLDHQSVLHSDLEEFLRPFEYWEVATIGLNSYAGTSLYSRKW